MTSHQPIKKILTSVIAPSILAADFAKLLE